MPHLNKAVEVANEKYRETLNKKLTQLDKNKIENDEKEKTIADLKNGFKKP